MAHQGSFELDGTVNLSSALPQRCRSMHVSITNSLHVCLFDKSDEALINDYVQKVVYYTLLRTTNDVVSRIGQKQQLPLMPWMAQYALYQMVSKMFEIEPTHEIIKDTYKENYDKAIEEYDQNVAPGTIQQNIQDRIDEDLKGLVSNYAFQQIVEQILRQALQQQHQIMAQQVAYKRAQYILAQQQVLQQVIQERLKQYAMQAYQTAMQRNVRRETERQAISNQIEATVRQSYEQALRQYEQAMRQRFEIQVQNAAQGLY